MEKPDEPGEIARLRERVRQLEQALADATIDKALEESYFEILCEQTGVNSEAFKKKHGGTPSIGRGRRKSSQD